MSMDPRYSPVEMPKPWKVRLSKGLCAVCGKKKRKNERFLQGSVHRSHACAVPWAAVTWTWGNFRNEYLSQPGLKCALCGRPRDGTFQLDHKIPVAAGGAPRDLKNLQPLCERCHRMKTKQDIRAIIAGNKVDIFARQARLATLAGIDERFLWACRVCGCTKTAACEGGCSWIEKDLCSNCL